MSTTCDKIRDQLSAYLDGELAPQQQEELATHLASCPACDRELTLLRQVHACLRADEDPLPSPRATELFYARLAARSAKRSILARLSPAGWLRVTWATGLAALLLLGIWAYNKDNHPYVERHEVKTQTSTTVGEISHHVRKTDHSASGRKPGQVVRVANTAAQQSSRKRPVIRHHRRPPTSPKAPAPPRLDNQPAPAMPDVTIAAISDLTETAEVPDSLPPPCSTPGNGELVCVADASASFATPESAIIALIAETAE